MLRKLVLAVTTALVVAAPRAASAFCGFYVSGADASLFNNATLVVLMREGTRTVLSMQNNYQGPASDFAMVVPVPVVLQKENVKTLPREIFSRVDQLAAPRLVEYWEQDPCRPMNPPEMAPPSPTMVMADEGAAEEEAKHYGVKIEAKFSVGEYQILILGASDSMGLDSWLRHQGYRIPAGAEPVLRPYVQSGMKFFVAKVDVKKVRFDKGQAMLSPLRFHYDSEAFFLPVRLGLVNSAGTQDLIVHVLARGVRYEVANYDNYAIPTNIDVSDRTKAEFGAFYASLFDRMQSLHPRAVITEYAWDSGSCDPCPTEPLSSDELATLGADVLPSVSGAASDGEVDPSLLQSFVLTRLHARYKKESLGDDLVFRAAPPIEGGRGVPDREGKLPRGVQQGGMNNFQGRYVIRHPWTGAVACNDPQRGIWGGPTDPAVASNGRAQPALNLAFAPREGVDLASFLAGPVAELDDPGGTQPLPKGPVATPPIPSVPPRGGCASCEVESLEAAPWGALALAAIGAALASRRAALGRRAAARGSARRPG